MAESKASIGQELFCRVPEGVLGEIKRDRSLSSEEVERVLGDPTVVQDICPGGNIVTKDGTPVFSSPSPISSLPDFNALQEKLQKSSE